MNAQPEAESDQLAERETDACAHCGKRVWAPSGAWIHWVTGRRSCAYLAADAAPRISTPPTPSTPEVPLATRLADPGDYVREQLTEGDFGDPWDMPLWQREHLARVIEHYSEPSTSPAPPTSGEDA